ncbi:MAG: hypothetical protein IKD93_08535 [Firmicutes bacterium]|nr:hypothetical protein [Bacillota bacterium]
MLECQSCGLRFDRPARRREERGCCFGLPARETVSGCPRCGGGFIEIGEGGGRDEF